MFLHDFAVIESGATLFAAQIDKVFRIKASQVCKIRCKTGSKGKTPHRPLALDANQETTMVYFIGAEYVSGSCVIPRDVLNSVEREFRKCLIYSRIWSFLARSDDVVYATTGSPKEKV
jgi:hypothetical protein